MVPPVRVRTLLNQFHFYSIFRRKKNYGQKKVLEKIIYPKSEKNYHDKFQKILRNNHFFFAIFTCFYLVKIWKKKINIYISGGHTRSYKNNLE